MTLLILIPAFFCAFAIFRGGTQYAFYRVCIPTIMLLPTYYFWKVPLLPPLDFVKAVMVVLGIGMLFTDLPAWRFSRTDLWILLFIASGALAERPRLPPGGNYRVGSPSSMIIAVFTQLASAFFPYMAGKLLIEQPGARIATTKRFVSLLAIVSVLSMYEYVMKANPFRQFWTIVFPNQNPGWTTQIRWGFGRVAGPYAQSELAGMILLTGTILALWLAYWRLWAPRFKEFPTLPFKKSLVITSTLFVCLFMTQARGPWLGTIVAATVAFIGRSKRILRTTVIVAGVALAVGIPAYLAAHSYVDAPTASDEQQTAQYREQLWANYEPLAIKGGLWGWGQDFPKVYMQASIDNQYLFTWMTQGYLGGILFILIVLDSEFSLLRAGLAATTRRDRHFIFSLLGILTGIVFTLGTVFLGEQTYEIFFILIGWSQSQFKTIKSAPGSLRVYT